MRTFVAAVLLAAAPVLAASPVLEDVTVLPGSRPVVTVRLSAPAEFRARALQADGIAPHRLYVDLADTALGPTAPRVRNGAGAVIRVRTGQFDAETARIVLDLSGEMPFEVRADGNTLTVTLSPPPPAAQSKAPPPVAESESMPVAPVAKPEMGPSPQPAAAPQDPPAPVVATSEKASPATEPAEPATKTAPLPPPVATPEPTPAAPEPPPIAAPELPAAPKTPPATADSQGKPAAREALPARRHSTSAAIEPPLAGRPLVGPPVPEAPTRPLTPQDVIVMSVPKAPPPEAAATPTTIQPAPTSAEARSATAAVAPADVPPTAPPSVEPPKPAPKRSTRVTPAPTPRPLIVLDAGHGGRDPGAEGVGGVIEKDVVLELTRVLAKRMTDRLRVDVFLTRTDDSYVTIDRRLAVPSDASLFISLHANSCPDPSARGLEVFYGGGAVRPADTAGASSRAALLGQYLNDALSDRVGGVRGSARLGSFSVLVRNPLPSALIEIGYLTHPEEAVLSQDSVYRELMADAVVDGLDAFLRAAAPPL
jgi:N-acetylmuramoyl-L-alanine amidase